MKTTTRRAASPRISRRTRHQPWFELLEAKVVLSTGFDPSFGPSDISDFNGDSLGDTLTVATVDPADGSVVSQAPRRFVVTFDRPIDPGSLNYDLRLDALDADGNWNPLADGGYTSDEQVDDSGTAIVASFQGLADGTYRLVLSGSAGVTGLDGSAAFPDDQTLSTFTIRSAGFSLADATDLGTIGSDPTSVLGSVDFSANPTDFKLYRFEVAPGHHYRFLGEISAQRDGNPTQVALSLFDSNGLPIASASVGRSDAPSDPFLFRGLDEGTYYLGVTAKGNTPNLPGGFDPSTGSAGIPTPSAQGGAFRLDVVADPADAPTGVRDLFLRYQDPTSAMPTGFTIQFTGAIDADSLATSPMAVTLVDSKGAAWPITVTGYNESEASLTFAFDKQLPPDRYFVTIPQGGLTDLAGLHPTAAGRPDGVLGTFEVGRVDLNFSRLNIGTLTPSAAIAGVTKYLSVSAGATIESKMTVIVPGIYTIDSNYRGGAPTIELIGPDGQLQATPTSPAPGRARAFVTLNPGVYTLRITAQPGRASLVDEWVTLKASLADSLLDNGVGQGAALGLRLINPSALTPDSVPTPSSTTPIGGLVGSGAPDGPTAGRGSETGSTPGETVSSSGGGSIVSNPTGGVAGSNVAANAGGSILFALGGTGALGIPSGSSSIGVVGPTAQNGSTAIASLSNGIPQGIPVGVGESNLASDGFENENPAGDDDSVEPAVASVTNGRLPNELLSREATIDSLFADGGRTNRDGSTLETVLNLEPITARLAMQWPTSLGSTVTTSDPNLDPLAELVPGIEDGTDEEKNEEGGDASSSLGVGLIAVAAAHFQGRLGRWFGRSKRRSTSKRLDGGTSVPRGPHRPRRG